MSWPAEYGRQRIARWIPRSSERSRASTHRNRMAVELRPHRSFCLRGFRIPAAGRSHQRSSPVRRSRCPRSVAVGSGTGCECGSDRAGAAPRRCGCRPDSVTLLDCLKFRRKACRACSSWAGAGSDSTRLFRNQCCPSDSDDCKHRCLDRCWNVRRLCGRDWRSCRQA